jgi:hypothetical protein
MSIHGYVGNIITANPTAPTVNSASGVWTTEQQLIAMAAGNWPMAATQISRSLRFNSADSAYLNRTFASAGNQKTWTWSGWVKRSTSGFKQLFVQRTLTNDWAIFYFNNDDFTFATSISSTQYYIQTSAIYRDFSAWYHIVVAVDTTQATSTNRVKIYVNGTQVTSFSTATYPPQNSNLTINSAAVHEIGQQVTVQYFDGYMTEINFIDGQQLTSASFGQTNSNTGVWEPRQYTGPYGTNGFYLNFSDNSNTTAATLGKDYSGNGNNWTPNNFSVTAGAGNDSLVDSPTAYGTDTGVGGSVRGNYATWNPLMKASQVTLTNGNLDAAHGTFGTNTGVFGGIAVSSGKWYWEETITALSSGAPFIGIMKPEAITQTFTTMYANTTSGYAYRSTGDKRTNSSDSAYGASYTTNDVIGVALDMDAGTLVFYKNGVSQGTAFSSLSGTFVAADANGTSGGTYSSTINFGQRAFAYTAPSGFKALCTTNLPTPTIGATSTTQAGKYFGINLWTGNGSTGSRAITGLGFKPDWVWWKNRTTAKWHQVFDSNRGADKALSTNATDAEDASGGYGGEGSVTSFDSDGYTLQGGVGNNENGSAIVGWAWQAGQGTNSSNTAGTITSTVSANTTSGFSIVTSGVSTSAFTVGHGLGVAPAMMISKTRNVADSWYVYHQSLAATESLRLNTTGAVTTGGFNGTRPTSTVLTLGGFGSSSYTNVVYCFAAVAGYSAFGSYTGNGSTDGPFVFLGFRPRYIMRKRTDTTAYWVVFDTARNTYNVVGEDLYPNDSLAGSNDFVMDILSNGFKIRGTGANINANGGTYIYMAFAENPFKYALAR